MRNTFNFGHKTKRAGLLLTSALATAAFLPGIAAAQDEASAEEDIDDDRVIIVTARQRAENIQSVPLAITAFDAEAIKDKNIENLDDVARFTAGFAFEDGQGGFAFPTIRGQSQLFTTAREQPTAVFLNGVYLPRSWLVDLGVKDLQRIEIVKGPQSSRYGRNAFSGAINYVSNSADLEKTGVNGSATYGNRERFDIGGAVNIPIISDRLAIRASMDHTQNDGTWKNTHPNNGLIDGPATEGNVGGINREAYSLNILAEPVDGLRISGRYNRFEIADEATAGYWLNTNLNQGTCGTVIPESDPLPAVGPRLFCGNFGVLDDTVEIEPRAYGRRVDADIYALDVNWEISEAVTLSYLFGRVEARSDGQYSTEPDQVACGGLGGLFALTCNFQGGLTGEVEYDSHEARARFSSGNLDIEVGGIYVDGEDRPVAISVNIPAGGLTNQRVDPVNTTAFPDFSNFIFGREITVTKVKALFGEIGYAFNEGATRVSAEVRYTDEELTTTNLRAALGPNNPLNETFKFWTPRFTLEHDIGEDTLLYATVARGAKAGGFNAGAFNPDNLTFDPEFNWTYEVGAKGSWSNATVNVAAFMTKWSNQQVTAADPDDPGDFSRVLIRNIGDATIYGAELEAAVWASDNLSFDGTLSYISSTFDDGTVDVAYRAFRFGYPPSCDGIVCDPATGDISGNDLPRTPRFQASAGAEYRAPYNGNGDEYFIRVDGSYQDGFFADTINAAKSPSRFLANARAGIEFGNFDIAIWARNMFDKKYVSTSTSIIQSGGGNLFGAYYGERRTVGITASFDY
ncbi:TonB-dependent receptor [Altererythrobacter sp. GH1-8]|uniref:TonB-dependent receptor n=1 Tax=Altererythrobacter sp. GH1-8 TaxID=3349333 RepID=UPI00374CAB8F